MQADHHNISTGGEINVNRLEAVRHIIENFHIHPYEISSHDDMYEPMSQGEPFAIPLGHKIFISASAVISSPFNERRHLNETDLIFSVKAREPLKPGEEPSRGQEMIVRVYQAKRSASGDIDCEVVEQNEGKFRIWKAVSSDLKVDLTYLGPAREGKARWMEAQGNLNVSESHGQGEDTYMEGTSQIG